MVTHDRRELLLRCLHALVEQTRPPDEILVVDNASRDGSAAVVAQRHPDVRILRLEENVGGAGGFHRGVEWAHARGHGWLWLMDDDTIPQPDALRALLAGAARAPGGEPLVVASLAVWRDGSPHPMNRPWPRWRWLGELALGAERDLVLIRAATFVSCAVRREAVDRFGLPLGHYFIWSDDIEYTARVLRDERGYLVPDSVVEHRTRTPHTALSASGGRFYFHVRNTLLLLRGTSLDRVERLHHLRGYVHSLLVHLRANRSPQAVMLVLRGLRDGLRGDAR